MNRTMVGYSADLEAATIREAQKLYSKMEKQVPLAGILFGSISVTLTYVIIFAWLHTGIFEEGENIRISNKVKNINTVFSKRQVERISLNHGTLEITTDGGVVSLGVGDFSLKQINPVNERLRSMRPAAARESR